MTTDPTQASQSDPIGRELMRQAQLISQLRRDLDDVAHGITDIAAGLLARLEDLGQPDAATTAARAWTWKDIGREDESELWSQLRSWVA